MLPKCQKVNIKLVLGWEFWAKIPKPSWSLYIVLPYYMIEVHQNVYTNTCIPLFFSFSITVSCNLKHVMVYLTVTFLKFKNYKTGQKYVSKKLMEIKLIWIAKFFLYLHFSRPSSFLVYHSAKKGKNNSLTNASKFHRRGAQELRLLACMKCTSTPLGLWPSCLGVDIRQITSAHDTTIT